MSTATFPKAPRSLLGLTAADLMSTPVLTIPQETSLREAARLLTRDRISGAPVVDAEGRCVGVLSSSDFVTWAEADGGGTAIRFIAPWGEMIDIEESADSEIRRYMTAQPVTVAPAAPVGELARMMVDAHIHRVLVVENDRARGIVTSTDILAAVARAAQKAAAPAARKPGKKARPARH